jgi:hypothetical protein
VTSCAHAYTRSAAPTRSSTCAHSSATPCAHAAHASSNDTAFAWTAAKALGRCAPHRGGSTCDAAQWRCKRRSALQRTATHDIPAGTWAIRAAIAAMQRKCVALRCTHTHCVAAICGAHRPGTRCRALSHTVACTSRTRAIKRARDPHRASRDIHCAAAGAVRRTALHRTHLHDTSARKSESARAPTHTHTHARARARTHTHTHTRAGERGVRAGGEA